MGKMGRLTVLRDAAWPPADEPSSLAAGLNAMHRVLMTGFYDDYIFSEGRNYVAPNLVRRTRSAG